MKNIKLDEKLLKVMGIAIGGLILFIILIALVASCTNSKKYTADNINDLETKLIDLAKRYYNTRESELPKDGAKTTLSVNALVEAEMSKPLNEIIENGDNCSGEITIYNNNSFYLYIPKIDCGKMYKAKNLAKSLTDEANIITSGEGLYQINGEYIFRGENTNNYLMFANKTWVILKVYADGTIKIMETTKRDSGTWDNRYNSDKNSSLGINDYITNGIDSRVKTRLESIYQDDKEFTDTDRAHILKQNLCVGKRSINEVTNDGSIECATLLENQALGMITVSEYMQASLDSNCKTSRDAACTNYNYLAKIPTAYWTITTDKDTSYKAYKISRNISLVNASNSSPIKATAVLINDLLFNKGDGSADNPYQLITSPTTSKKK